nr:hypothetical protein [uncultured Mediterranean phage uvMED]
MKLLKFDREKWQKKLNKLSKDDLVNVLLQYEYDRIARINTNRQRINDIKNKNKREVI